MNASQHSGNSFALLFVDLDRFKLINDSLSHAAGDELLRAVTKRMKARIRKSDAIARLGGDEFVVVLNSINRDSDISERALEILDIFIEPFRISERELPITASIGISIYPRDGDAIETLLCNADLAMYHAKELKGNNFQIYSAKMNKSNIDKLDYEISLRQAIDNNEFFLCYQPQFNLLTEKLVAVEALVRWRHPVKGILLPIDFVPLAEETGLIIPIGEWVLREACRQCKSWQLKGLTPIRVAVNVSVQQFRHQNLVSLVKNVLIETDLDPKYLELEITESVIINNIETIRIITELKKLGVIITLDDFGTGYSSLGYLKLLPLDKLKIDKTFIDNIQTADDKDVISEAIISIAKHMNLGVLAEGVETKNQVNFLKLHDCGEVQGLYFSRPLKNDELEKILVNSPDLKLSQIDL